jgi:hypothetical protein
VFEYPAVQAANRADLDALAAELAVQLSAETGLDYRIETPLDKVNLSLPLYLITDPDTLAALDAAGLVALDEGGQVVDLLLNMDRPEPARILSVLESQILQPAAP